MNTVHLWSSPFQTASLSVVLPAHFAARSLAQRGSITKGLNVCIVAAASATRVSGVGREPPDTRPSRCLLRIPSAHEIENRNPQVAQFTFEGAPFPGFKFADASSAAAKNLRRRAPSAGAGGCAGLGCSTAWAAADRPR